MAKRGLELTERYTHKDGDAPNKGHIWKVYEIRTISPGVLSRAASAVNTNIYNSAYLAKAIVVERGSDRRQVAMPVHRVSELSGNLNRFLAASLFSWIDYAEEEEIALAHKEDIKEIALGLMKANYKKQLSRKNNITRRIYFAHSDKTINGEFLPAAEGIVEVADLPAGRFITWWQINPANEVGRFTGVGHQLLLYVVNRELRENPNEGLGFMVMGETAVNVLKKQGIELYKVLPEQELSAYLRQQSRETLDRLIAQRDIDTGAKEILENIQQSASSSSAASSAAVSDLSRGGWVNIHPSIRNWSVRGLESESDVRTMNNEIFVEGGLRGLVRSMKDAQGSDLTHFILVDDKGAMVAAYQVAERKENLLARTQAGLQQRVVASVSGNFAVHPDYSRRGLMRILDLEGKPVSIGSNFFNYAKDEWLRQGVGMLFGRSINEKGIKFWESVGGVTPMGSAISLEPSARVKKVDLEPQYSDLGKTYYRRIFDLKPYTSQTTDEGLAAALINFTSNPQADLFNNTAARVMYENLFRIEDLLWVLERFARITRSSGLSDDVIARLLARVIQTDQSLVEVLKLRKEEMGRYEIQPQQELADVVAKSLVAAQQGARGSSPSVQIKFPFEVLELARKENEIPEHEKELLRMINLRNQRAKNNPEGTRGFIFIDPRFADVVLDKVLTPAHTRVASLERIYWEIAILYTLAARLLSRKDFKTVDGLVAFINRSDMYRLMDTIDASFKHTEVLAVAREVAVKRQHQDSLEGVDAFIRQELKAKEKAGHHFVMEVRHNGETIPLDIITRKL
ncbi:MAG: hypothetical protein PHG68_07805 [Candidatus Omnitrophica bacterium]|nr:hypothetical protein [Candidatus Omnitrophota bacterium]